MSLLVHLKRRFEPNGAKSYGDIGELVLGPSWRRVIDVVVTVQQLSICCVYFGFVGTNVEAILLSLNFEHKDTRVHVLVLMTLAYFLLAPLGQIRHWKRLAPLSLVANVCVVSGIVVALVYTLLVLVHSGISDKLPLWPTAAWNGGPAFTGLPLLFGSTIYSFELICNVLPIENAMAQPREVGRALAISMGCYCTLMQLAGILPLLSLGVITKGSLTAELGSRFTSASDTPVIVGMNVLVTIAVVLTFPIQLFPAIEVIERALGIGAGAGEAARARARRARLRDSEAKCVGLLHSEGCSAASDEVVAMGGTGQLDDARITDHDPKLATAPIAEYEQQVTCAAAPESVEVGGTEEADCALKRSHCSVVLLRLGLRMTVVAGALLVAVAVPKLGLIISLFGSLNAPLLTLVLPPILAIRALDPPQPDGSPGLGRQWLHLAILAIGVLGGVAGTVTAVGGIVSGTS